MATSLLYFPYIDVPKTDWTIRSLLYYEKVGSIVPQEYLENPRKMYDPYMLDLVNHKLVIPIVPSNELDRLYELNQPFIDFVQSPGYRIANKQERFNIARSAKVQLARINGQKFNEQVLYDLSNLGLARRAEGNWYEVEHLTASYLMAYLASVLARKLDMLPTTDSLSNINFLRQFRRTNTLVSVKRERLLHDLIPFPVEINMDKLQTFKVKYSKELNLFGTIVEEVALDPKYNDEKLLALKIEELAQHRDSLTAKMEKSNLGQILFGAICSIGSPALGIAAGGPIGIAGGALGLASAIYSASRIERPENIPDQTGMKYVALLNKRLRKKGH